ncbi:hypothetical protein [Aliivibrio salmonicida]|uniref:hypothetical protein n=1 Tax=Aliivibrio salmonicida TaxID=40269 RepID=UPI003D0E24AF
MSLLSEIKNVDGHFTSTLLVLFLSIISPGILIIYLFLPELFIKLDSLKFILFSVSLSLPVFVLNAFMTTINEKSETEIDFQVIGIATGIISSIIMFLSLIVSYVLDFSFNYFLITIFMLEVMYFLANMYFYIRSEKRSANKLKANV